MSSALTRNCRCRGAGCSSRACRLNLLGPYNDNPKRADGLATRVVALISHSFEQFKVPTPRNVALTAPFTHDGHFAKLVDVVRHYSETDPMLLHVGHILIDPLVPEAIPTDTLLKPLRLTPQEIADVVAFLATLSDGPPPRERAAAAPCR